MDDKKPNGIAKLMPVEKTRETLIQSVIKEMPLRARLMKAQYDQLITAGFTERQALELCKRLD